MKASDQSIVKLRTWLERARQETEVTLLWSGGYEDAYGAMQGMCGWGVKYRMKGWEQFAGKQLDPNELWMARVSYDLKNQWGHGLHSAHKVFGEVPSFELIAPMEWQALSCDGECVEDLEGFRELIGGCERRMEEQWLGLDGLRAEWDGLLKKKNQRLLEENGESIVISNGVDRHQNQQNAEAKAVIHWSADVTEEAYLDCIAEIQQHIVEGDFYELNYCISFTANEVALDPYRVFEIMAQVAPAPMMSFVKRGDHFLLSASMERYLLKRGDFLLSQPIKGTIRNAGASPEILANKLANSEKDRAENVMIVDLVRNDLSRVCEPGTVKVTELCGIYEYPQVLQMISTVIGKCKPETGLCACLENTFPMGSMTGAPKIEVMHHIEKIEKFARGWYSGAMGWVLGDDFDLNVVIRGIQYLQSKQQLQYAVGGAITIDSDPQLEYEECMAKASAMLKSLEASGYQSEIG